VSGEPFGLLNPIETWSSFTDREWYHSGAGRKAAIMVQTGKGVERLERIKFAANETVEKPASERLMKNVHPAVLGRTKSRGMRHT